MTRPDPMKVSASGRADIRTREGEVLHTYYDSVGVLTGGVGHTGRMSPPKLTPGMTITKAMSDAWLESDLAPVEAEINKRVKVPLTQNEFDALASWLFNVGEGALRTSTVLKRLNVGDMPGAAAALMMWVKPASLTSRRRGEMEQFLKRDPLDAPAIAGRAEWLDRMAIVTKTVSAGAGAVAAVAATTTVAAVSVAPQSPTAAAVVSSASLFVVALSGLLSWFQGRKAGSLAANANLLKI